MPSPFPGMDPYLEHPALWPDVHNRLIAAMGDELTPMVAPNYFVALERRSYFVQPNDLVFVGRPDLSVVSRESRDRAAESGQPRSAVLEVRVPISDEVTETFLEVHDVKTGTLVTVVELLSPANKVHTQGRRDYLKKREEILRTRTNLFEIDLLRTGEPMPIEGMATKTDYRILIGRGHERPRAQLHVFSVREPIPRTAMPLLPEDAEPTLDLNDVLHRLYQRARFDLRLDYDEPCEPPLAEQDEQWARELTRSS